MLKTLLALAVVLFNPSAARAQHETTAAQATHEEAQACVEQLDDDAYESREAAAERLREIGLPAAEVVREGLSRDNPDLRARCQRVLSEIYAQEHEQRIADFAAGIERPDEEELPRWKHFREVVGDNPASRQLYVEMLREEWDLLTMAENSPDALGELLTTRVWDIVSYRWRSDPQGVPLGSVATMLFLVSEVENPPPMLSTRIDQWCRKDAFLEVMQGGELQEIGRKLVGHWVESAAGYTRGENAVVSTLFLAMRYDLREGLATAAAVLQDDQLPLETRYFAMVAIAMLGDESHLPLIEPYMDDPSMIVYPAVEEQDPTRTQLRDVALVTQIFLQGANPAEFGIGKLNGRSHVLFTPTAIRFPDEEAREAAFAKWRQYQQDHPFG